MSSLRQAAQSLLDTLAQCSVTSGVCRCGDDMECHSNPMDAGHTPVDSGTYYTEQAVQALKEALLKQDQPK